MTLGPYQRALAALYADGGTPVIVGGIALVLHGVTRFTPDINVACDLSAKASQKAVENLLAARFCLDTGIEAEDLFNQQTRAKWLAEGKRFFSLKDPESPPLSVEIFLQPPMDSFELQKSAVKLSAFGQSFLICSSAHLIQMKELANRPQDKADLENLRLLSLILAQQDSALGVESLAVKPPAGFNREQVENMVNFINTSAEEKISWLTEMLSAMGMFCVFR